MDREHQIINMNLMLNYLGKKDFSIKFNGNYRETILVYTSQDSIMRKTVTEWTHDNKIKSSLTKEKALGGSNGDDMYKAIKEKTLESAKNKILKTAIQRELADFDIDVKKL